jgi:hypothetical protein
MKKFNANFKENKTQVRLFGSRQWRLITEINESRGFIRLKGFKKLFRPWQVESYK